MMLDHLLEQRAFRERRDRLSFMAILLGIPLSTETSKIRSSLKKASVRPLYEGAFSDWKASLTEPAVKASWPLPESGLDQETIHAAFYSGLRFGAQRSHFAVDGIDERCLLHLLRDTEEVEVESREWEAAKRDFAEATRTWMLEKGYAEALISDLLPALEKAGEDAHDESELSPHKLAYITASMARRIASQCLEVCKGIDATPKQIGDFKHLTENLVMDLWGLAKPVPELDPKSVLELQWKRDCLDAKIEYVLAIQKQRDDLRGLLEAGETSSDSLSTRYHDCYRALKHFLERHMGTLQITPELKARLRSWVHEDGKRRLTAEGIVGIQALLEAVLEDPTLIEYTSDRLSPESSTEEKQDPSSPFEALKFYEERDQKKRSHRAAYITRGIGRRRS